MIKNKNFQMTKEEYLYIASYLGNINFLIFGAGHDAEYWRCSNKKGKTLFLENDDLYIPKNKNDIIKIQYTCNINEYKEILEEYKLNNFSRLNIEIPTEIKCIEWNAIFVDSPSGYSNHCHGRMQSIFMAKQLSNENTNIFVHDCDRKIEDLYTECMFSRKIKQLTKLREVKI